MREAAGYIIFHGNGADRRFLLLRNARHKTWAFPKGHLEKGETPKEGARRELLEETGIRDLEEVDGFHDTVEYEVPAGKRPGASAYRKAVHMFLARVPARAWVRSAEHDDGTWMTADEVIAHLQFENLREQFRRALGALDAGPGRA